MTEPSVCCPNVENGIEKHAADSVPVQINLPVNSGTRPTAIPRLSSGNHQRSSHITSSNGKNVKSKIPFSPLNIKPHRPKSVGSYIKSPMQEQDNFNTFAVSPTYSKRFSRNSNVLSPQTTMSTDVRLRSNAKSLNRYDRAISEENQGRKTSMESSLSEKTNNSGNPGTNYVIASKIGSLANARHKPGGGHVRIFEEKLDFAKVESKCGSKSNIKHKPGGGTVEILSEKLDFTKKAQSKVNSLKNIEHQPLGGDVKIDNLKLEWNVTSKVGSMANIKHKPTGGNVQILNEPMPWLKFNKPHLPPEEKAKINKKSVKDGSKEGYPTVSRSCSNSVCSDRSN